MGTLGSLFLGCALMVACEAFAPLFGREEEKTIPFEYLVVLKQGANYLSPRTRGVVNIIQEFQINDWHAFHLYADDVSLEDLREDPNVEFVEVNSESGHITCSEQFAGKRTWGLPRTSQRSKPDYEHDAYLFDSDGSNVDVYIVDTGIYISHNDIKGRARHGIDKTDEGNGDKQSHGTHVGGTVAGSEYGVAKNANLIAVKVCNRYGRCSKSDVAAGIQWLTSDHQRKSNKRSVANMSLYFYPPSNIVERAINASIAAGVTFVVSAGNSGRNACLETPSRIPETLTCAASDIDDKSAYFTNYGECVDLFAPGVDIRSASISGPDDSKTMSGTSMAAPHATGVVARYLSTFDDDNIPTPAEVKAWITKTATVNAITLMSSQKTTPNLLLYAACD